MFEEGKGLQVELSDEIIEIVVKHLIDTKKITLLEFRAMSHEELQQLINENYREAILARKKPSIPLFPSGRTKKNINKSIVDNPDLGSITYP